MEISYSELRAKEVVNTLDGARMGRIIDIIFDSNGKSVLGLVVPGVRKLFKQSEDIFIPWRNINKIGNDVILVSIDVNQGVGIVRTENGKGEDCCADEGDYL